eukprot:CAMPEP_0170134254 /NCGR_PEP_ID=MMETSP0033_2-20121228/1783_1 /TAXON_ID=195969 /ORGANISM="Dolichomastix tenuilepis, Strain CCMP3274" /LENGTH=374 /DNA_ID=CAMNT_0010369799 /DNA_START=8 /DNA_END=1132 /DNA_ORIENTATION=-
MKVLARITFLRGWLTGILSWGVSKSGLGLRFDVAKSGDSASAPESPSGSGKRLGGQARGRGRAKKPPRDSAAAAAEARAREREQATMQKSAAAARQESDAGRDAGEEETTHRATHQATTKSASSKGACMIADVHLKTPPPSTEAKTTRTPEEVLGNKAICEVDARFDGAIKMAPEDAAATETFRWLVGGGVLLLAAFVLVFIVSPPLAMWLVRVAAGPLWERRVSVTTCLGGFLITSQKSRAAGKQAETLKQASRWFAGTSLWQSGLIGVVAFPAVHFATLPMRLATRGLVAIFSFPLWLLPARWLQLMSALWILSVGAFFACVHFSLAAHSSMAIGAGGKGSNSALALKQSALVGSLASATLAAFVVPFLPAV